jgi:predicted ATPase
LKETLHIKNFGPIKDVKLELGKVNVLIGDQGTGKSTVAKLLNAVKEFLFNDVFENNKFNTEDFIIILKKYEIFHCLKQDTEILFKIENQIEFKFNNLIASVLEKIIQEKSFKIKFHDFYIITERNIVNTISNILYPLIQAKAALSELVLKFGNLYITGKKDYHDISFNYEYEKILNTNLILINDKLYISLNGQTIPFEFASSGLQSCIPLLITFDKATRDINKYLSVDDRIRQTHKDFNKNLIIIEEPEQNLFPKTQYELTKYIISNIHYDIFENLEVGLKNENEKTKYINVIDSQIILSQLFITTHSPYILTSLNNLIYAYTIGQKNNKEVNDIINEKYWLNPADVSAYKLEYDEKEGGIIAKNIIDEETQLIDSIQIDGVSEILSEEFNEILEIELKN